MPTEKQRIANARNAKLYSTGPRTEAGKAVSCMNALKLGIDADSIVLPFEDYDKFVNLKDSYYVYYQPDGPGQAALLDTAIASDWQLRRLRQTEFQVWTRSMAVQVATNQKNDFPEDYDTLSFAYGYAAHKLDRLHRRIAQVERSLRTSLESFCKLRKEAALFESAPDEEVGQALSPVNPEPEPTQSLDPIPAPDPQPPAPTRFPKNKMTERTQFRTFPHRSMNLQIP